MHCAFSWGACVVFWCAPDLRLKPIICYMYKIDKVSDKLCSVYTSIRVYRPGPDEDNAQSRDTSIKEIYVADKFRVCARLIE